MPDPGSPSAASTYMLFDRESGNAIDSYTDAGEAQAALRQAVEADDPSAADLLVLIPFDAEGMPCADPVAFADLPGSPSAAKERAALRIAGATLIAWAPSAFAVVAAAADWNAYIVWVGALGGLVATATLAAFTWEVTRVAADRLPDPSPEAETIRSYIAASEGNEWDKKNALAAVDVWDRRTASAAAAVSPAEPPENERCPECKGQGSHHVERHVQVCGTFEDEETQANFCHANCSSEDVPCRVCKGSGRLVGIPRATYMARGGAAPVQRKGYA